MFSSTYGYIGFIIVNFADGYVSTNVCRLGYQPLLWYFSVSSTLWSHILHNGDNRRHSGVFQAFNYSLHKVNALDHFLNLRILSCVPFTITITLWRVQNLVILCTIDDGSVQLWRLRLYGLVIWQWNRLYGSAMAFERIGHPANRVAA